MAQSYFAAEHLKFKRTLFRKLNLIIPFALILLSVVFIFIGIGLGGFASSIVVNWCMPIASLSIVLLCHLVHHKEHRTKYHALYSLPIDLKKTFIAKTLLVALNLLLISLLLALITVASDSLASGFAVALGRSGYSVLGYVVLWLSLLWQIPLSLVLVQKIGFVGSVILQLLASAVGGLFFSLTPLFWFVPHSWTARLMVTLFGVMPNGLLVEAGSKRILGLGQSAVLLLLSLLAMLVLSDLLARWYRRQVNRR